ncbi:Spindle and kinetochore-associated protein 1 [Armadillidium nasatum]|uniref:SKA complex subunit 1 n=1 Tax=Armadillidium nasatum TaxID=96803 RepID=A0A5N5TN97_9CRUS|nr:Spindle and kinetochore-associated protein 1 [Armadillidium nasatum]
MNIVDSAVSLEELESGFNSKLSDLKVLNYIRGGWDKDTVEEILELQKELACISQIVGQYKEILQNGREEIEETKKLCLQIDALSDRLTYMKNNLPSHLPSVPDCVVPEKTENEPLCNSLPVPAAFTKADENIIKSKDPPKPAKTQKALPKVSYITLDEYELVPKYTKGRIPYTKVNSTIDDINKTVESKYGLMRKPRSKLSPIEMSMVDEYKRQMNKDTKGFYFVVDEDIKNFTQMKLDPSGRNTLTILRTLKRLKEVRGPGNLIRYCVT